jgi:hypothetical protein
VKASQADVDPLTGKPLTQSDASSPPQSPGPTTKSTEMEYTNVLILDEITTKRKGFKQARSRNATIKLSTDKKINITFTDKEDKGKNIELDLSVPVYDNISPGCQGLKTRNMNINSPGRNAKCLKLKNTKPTELLSSDFTIQFRDMDDCDTFKNMVVTIHASSGRSSSVKYSDIDPFERSSSQAPQSVKPVNSPPPSPPSGDTGFDDDDDDDLDPLGLIESKKGGSKDGGGKRRRHTIKKNRRSIRRTTIRRRQYKNNNKKNRSFKK